MTDIKALTQSFNSGELVRPDSEPGLTDLMASIADLIGVSTLVREKNIIDLGSSADHVVFVLDEGLGSEI